MGYLGLVILLEEGTDVLMLVTNSLKNDLSHTNPFIAGLAACALGNIGSTEMARGLTGELEKMLAHSNPYIRKKAALCAIRVCEKVPEMTDDLIEKIPSLLDDRDHGVLVSAISFIIATIEKDPSHADYFRGKIVSKIVKLLKNLVSSGYAPEYDVGGITDPFLQVNIIRLLRLLGTGNEEASEKMGDILAQVATNTESAKNAGNAILYETVLTILAIESAGGHRVLAINILGKFLLNRDNNIRYVALLCLGNVIKKGDMANVVRHYDTIVGCLKDPDVSIRRRAMDLVYELVNENTVRQLGREMLSYLVMAGAEERVEICERMTEVIENHAPSPRWHIDTLMTMFRIAGASVSEHTEALLVHLISKNPDLHSYAVHYLYRAVEEEMHQAALTRAAVWAIGEFGNLLLLKCEEIPEAIPKTGEEILFLLEKLMKSHSATVKSKSVILNALIKLCSGRLNDANSMNKIQQLLSIYSTSIELELQKRSCEYSALANSSWAGLRPDVLKLMPPVELSVIRKLRGNVKRRKAAVDDDDDDDDDEDDEDDDSPRKKNSPKKTAKVVTGGAPLLKAAPVGGGGLLDLDDIFGGTPSTAPVANVGVSKPATGGANLLDDIFGSIAPTGPAATTALPKTNSNPLDDLLGGLMPSTTNPAPVATNNSFMPLAAPTPAITSLPPGTISIYDKDNLSVVFVCKVPDKAPPGALMVQAVFKNTGSIPMTDFVFQAAVLKVRITFIVYIKIYSQDFT
jgi:AP-1 complex subunit gamma-1